MKKSVRLISSLHLCSVSFLVMNLCQIQQCATVFSELIECISSVLALWRLKLLFKL